MSEDRRNLLEERLQVREELQESLILAKADSEHKERHRNRAKARWETFQKIN